MSHALPGPSPRYPVRLDTVAESWGGEAPAVFRLVCKSYMTCSFFLFPFPLEDGIPSLCWEGCVSSIVFSYVLEDSAGGPEQTEEVSS